MNLKCKNMGLSSCKPIVGCSAIRSMKRRWTACAVARDYINGRCWNKGDAGHQKASEQAWINVSNCAQREALPEPIGCADGCPLDGDPFAAAPPAALHGGGDTGVPTDVEVARAFELMEALGLLGDSTDAPPTDAPPTDSAPTDSTAADPATPERDGR